MTNTNNDIRKLVTIKKVDKVKAIEGADLIELIVIGGWQVVTKKGEFKVGEKVLYFEVDSFLPNTVEPFKFLSEKSSKKAINPAGEEVTGHVLKTIRLRGEISQGFALSPKVFSEDLENYTDEELAKFVKSIGVFKYEKPLHSSRSGGKILQGSIIAHYPSHTKKTDSERVQNLTDEFLQMIKKEATSIIATEKVDGSSTTWWKDETGKLRFASRNYELDLEQEPQLQELAKEYGLDEVLQPNETLKAEMYGEKIQKNPLKIKGRKLAIFDWESPTRELPKELEPYKTKVYPFELPDTVEEAVKQVDNLKSLLNPDVLAEGVVWWITPQKEYKELGFRPNFKAINNTYLLKH